MAISDNDIKYVANLARLNLSEKESEKLIVDLQSIISYVDKLNELDVSNVEPMNHVMDVENVFREDKVEKSYDREEILKNAPETDSGCFRVPKIVE